MAILAQGTGTTGTQSNAGNTHADGQANQQPKQLSEMSIEELGNVQVFSASKHSQSTSEAPASVTVITREEIQRYGYRTLADILRNVRGMYITYDKIYNFVGVRGFGRPQDFNTRVLLLVDGHRINDNVFDQAMLGTEFWVDVDLIERVEVIRGPSSSLYGANAFFGIINVITRKPADIKDFETSFEPATLGGYKGRATYSHNFKGMDALLSASFYNRQGPESLDTFTNLPAFGERDNLINILGEASRNGFTLQVVSGYRDKGNGASFGTPSSTDSRLYAIDEHHYIDLTYRHTFSKDWTLFNRVYYDPYGFKELVPFSADSPMTIYSTGRWWGDEVQISHTFAKKHEVTFGFELRDNVKQFQNQFIAIPPIILLLDERTSQDWGFYGQDQYAINSKLTLSMGVRLDKYGSFAWTVNPRVGLIYHPVEKTVFKLLYGSAFRPPNAFEAANPSAGPVTPETIKSFEGIWEQSLSERYRATVDVYSNGIQNLITGNVNFFFANTGNARSTGVEVELEGHYPGGLMGKVSYAYTRATDSTTHLILSNSPFHIVKLNLSVPLFKKHLFVSTDAQYEGSRSTPDGIRLPGFPIFNLTLFTCEWQHLEFTASVYNIFDKSYALPLAIGSLPQDGRSVRGKITWRFSKHAATAR